MLRKKTRRGTAADDPLSWHWSGQTAAGDHAQGFPARHAGVRAGAGGPLTEPQITRVVSDMLKLSRPMQAPEGVLRHTTPVALDRWFGPGDDQGSKVLP